MRIVLVLLTATSGWMAGCGSGDPGCAGQPFLSVNPARAVVDSSAKAPGNQQQFTAASGYTIASPSGACATPNVLALVHPVWTNPDPLHIAISSADDSTNGLAVCKAATGVPVTLTATHGTGANAVQATVSLSCE